MKKMIVTNLINSRGNAVKNQFVITEGNTIAFQSYNSRICEIVRPCGMGYNALVRFGRDWNYSRTTTKHLYSFLWQNGFDVLTSKKDIEEAIERGHARRDEAIAVVYDDSMR